MTLLEGVGEVVIDGEATGLVPYDTTYIAAGQPHLFRNAGGSPMRILWIYPTQHVTRTIVATGETIAHLSDADMMG